MNRLLVKDLKSVGLFWLAGLIVDFLFIVVFAEVNLAFLFVQVILTFLVSLVQPAIEDRFGVAPFINSLPVSRAQVVRAQYIGTGILIAGGLAVYSAVPAVLGSLAPSRMMAASPLLTLPGIASYLLPVVGLEVLFLPLYFRLGLGRAIWAFLGALLGLGGLMTGATKLLSGLTGKPLSVIFPLDREVMRIPYKPFLPLAGKLRDSLGTAGLEVLVFAVAAGLVWVSIRLSFRFYRKCEF